MGFECEKFDVGFAPPAYQPEGNRKACGVIRDTEEDPPYGGSSVSRNVYNVRFCRIEG